MAELEELQANPTRAARGTVLEAALDKKAGAVTSLLVQNGTLKVGDAIQVGAAGIMERGVVWRAVGETEGAALVSLQAGGACGPRALARSDDRLSDASV